MKTTIITTVRHNVGDDFVREGIVHLLKGALHAQDSKVQLEIELVHKHTPVTAVFGMENVRSLRVSKILDPVTKALGLRNRIDQSELLIQSGAPIYWCHENGSACENNEWYDPLVRKRFLPNRRNRKFLNLAGGSCQRYYSDGSEISKFPKTAAYIAEFHDACNLTTLRDELALKMLNYAGRDAPVLPCTSIFARDNLDIAPRDGEYIVLNFMEGGGHFSFGQKIDNEKWRENFKKIASLVSKMGKVVVACHNAREMKLAQEVTPDLECFLVPDNHIEFMKFYASARFGIVNRVHSGFMLASFGKPVAVIGTDTRALMIKNMDLPSYFVEDIDDVDAIVEKVAAQEKTYAANSDQIRKDARDQYIQLIADTLESSGGYV